MVDYNHDPRNRWGTVSVDADSTVHFHDFTETLGEAQDRLHRWDVPDGAVYPVKWGYVPIGAHGYPEWENAKWLEPAAV